MQIELTKNELETVIDNIAIAMHLCGDSRDVELWKRLSKIYADLGIPISGKKRKINFVVSL